MAAIKFLRAICFILAGLTIPLGSIYSNPIKNESLSHSVQKNSEKIVTAVTFKPPEGWRSVDASLLSPNVKALVIGPGSNTYPPSINLATESYSGNFTEYLKIVKSIGERKGVHWKDLGPFKTELGVGRLTQLDTQSEWGDVRMIHLIVLNQGTVFIVTAAALKDDFSKYYKIIFDSLRSLQIQKE